MTAITTSTSTTAEAPAGAIAATGGGENDGGESDRLRIRWLGTVDYAEAWDLQRALFSGGYEHLLLCQHRPVYTFGVRGDPAHLLTDPAELGADVYRVDRGGDVTFHGPGQLVGYPVIDLRPDRRDVRRYVRDLEEVLIRTLADYGIAGEPALSPRPVGVWVGARKIASLGIHLRHWVATHGFALNVATDLSFFGGIVACGMPGAPITSIQELTGTEPGLAAVAERVAGHFCAVFERVSAPIAPADLEAT
jgi:lipoyl(octanoyl) transferase